MKALRVTEDIYQLVREYSNGKDDISISFAASFLIRSALDTINDRGKLMNHLEKELGNENNRNYG